MTTKQLPSQTELQDNFDYCENTGQLLRDGAPVGSMRGGYLWVSLKDESYSVHRIIWKLFYGTEPECIDHIDRNSLNNRLDNLRECTRSENQQNRSTPKNNTSGVKGVHYDQDKQRWCASVKVNGKSHKKRFKTFEEAAAHAQALRFLHHPEFTNQE